MKHLTMRQMVLFLNRGSPYRFIRSKWCALCASMRTAGPLNMTSWTLQKQERSKGCPGRLSSCMVAVQVYDKYAPYQFLVYWFELRQGYVELFGSLADMDPADYAKATGAPLVCPC